MSSSSANGSRRSNMRGQPKEGSPLLEPGALTLNYNSDSAVYALEARDRTCDG